MSKTCLSRVTCHSAHGCTISRIIDIHLPQVYGAARVRITLVVLQSAVEILEEDMPVSVRRLNAGERGVVVYTMCKACCSCRRGG